MDRAVMSQNLTFNQRQDQMVGRWVVGLLVEWFVVVAFVGVLCAFEQC